MALAMTLHNLPEGFAVGGLIKLRLGLMAGPSQAADAHSHGSGRARCQGSNAARRVTMGALARAGSVLSFHGLRRHHGPGDRCAQHPGGARAVPELCLACVKHMRDRQSTPVALHRALLGKGEIVCPVRRA